MPKLFTVLIHNDNGHVDEHHFNQFFEARDFYQNKISYTGWHITRVEVRNHYGNVGAVWDRSWDAVSKFAGLNN